MVQEPRRLPEPRLPEPWLPEPRLTKPKLLEPRVLVPLRLPEPGGTGAQITRALEVTRA